MQQPMLLTALAVAICMATPLAAQTCDASLCGTVLDAESGKPIPFAEVFIQETATGAVTDASGRFHIHNLCRDTFTVDCNHIGCPAVSKRIFISGNVEVDFQLRHEATHLDEIVVSERAVQPVSMQAEQRLSGAALVAVQGQTLGDALKNLQGVNTVNTGSTVAKPVVQGLHSNRVLLLNNGVRQEGQQWGLDHGPEIDPYTAGELRVVMGANSVRYGADALGGVIIIDPKPLREQPGLGGELNLAGFSNGRTGVVSGLVDWVPSLESRGTGHGSRITTRLQGTLKRGGNTHSTDYFLENTGVKETNASAAVGLQRKRFSSEVFYSYFFTQLSIFEGAHIGNLTDLQLAIDRGRPIDDGSFTYKLGRPAQRVAHHLLKANSEWEAGSLGKLSLVYARQFNRRQEFDAHSPGGNLPEALEVPSLEFEITTHTADLVLEHKPLWRRFSGSVGVQVMQQVNTTDRGGLIPNFDSQTAGVFLVERWRKYPFPLELEAGIRYDLRRLNVDNRGNEIINRSLDYSNLSGTLGALFRFSENIKGRFHFGSAWRAPSVNELYSDGVHHGSASYEQGRDDLAPERAFSSNLGFDFLLPQNENGHGFSANLSLYRNRIDDFIFLEPQEDPVLTIRGAFPAFRYEQTKARLTGLDWNAEWRPAKFLAIGSGISLLRAKNLTTDEWLIFMPADRLRHSVRISRQSASRETFLKLTMQNVLKQTRVPEGQDFAEPPAGYTLFDLEGGTQLNLNGQPLTLGLTVQNLFNTRYRDYLNRLRYYASDLGRNVSVRINLKF